MIEAAEPVPDWILPIRVKAAQLAKLDPEELVEVRWQHHVPPTKSLRYSITFRTLRKRSS